jgi:hypothetical protein
MPDEQRTGPDRIPGPAPKRGDADQIAREAGPVECRAGGDDQIDADERQPDTGPASSAHLLPIRGRRVDDQDGDRHAPEDERAVDRAGARQAGDKTHLVETVPEKPEGEEPAAVGPRRPDAADDEDRRHEDEGRDQEPEPVEGKRWKFGDRRLDQ